MYGFETFVWSWKCLFCEKVFAFKNFLYSWKSFFIVGKSPDCGKVFWSAGLLRNLGNIYDSELCNIALQLRAANYCCIAFIIYVW